MAGYQIIELDSTGARIDDFSDVFTETQLDAWLANSTETVPFRDYTGYRFGGDDRIYSFIAVS